MAGTGGPKPWERQPGEGAAAFRAFQTYLNMGPERNLRQAYRNQKGYTHAKQANGTWNRWYREYRWLARARAWDDRSAVAAQAAAEKAAAAHAAGAVEEWLGHRDRQIRADFLLGRKMLAKVDALANFPVVRQEVSEDGKLTFSPIAPEALVAAARVAQYARHLIWESINAGLATAQPSSEGTADAAGAAEGTELPPLPPGAVAEAVREAESQRLELLLTGFWGKAAQGDAESAALVMRIMDRRARLLGLDLPSTAALAAGGDRSPGPTVIEVELSGVGVSDGGPGNGEGYRNGTGYGTGNGNGYGNGHGDGGGNGHGNDPGP